MDNLLVQKDFIEGLMEMQRMSGDTSSSEEDIRAKFSLPVLTISSVNFQKLTGARTSDGAANVWASVEDTEVGFRV